MHNLCVHVRLLLLHPKPVQSVQRVTIAKTQRICHWSHTSSAKYLNNIFNNSSTTTTTFIVTVRLSKMKTLTMASSLDISETFPAFKSTGQSGRQKSSKH